MSIVLKKFEESVWKEVEPKLEESILKVVKEYGAPWEFEVVAGAMVAYNARKDALGAEGISDVLKPILETPDVVQRIDEIDDDRRGSAGYSGGGLFSCCVAGGAKEERMGPPKQPPPERIFAGGAGTRARPFCREASPASEA